MDALLFLRKNGVPENVIKHTIAVNKLAMEMARKIAKKHKVDMRLVDEGSLMHDIGRAKTHGIDHGVVGAKMLRKMGINEGVCRIAERHILAGVAKSEAKGLGLPEADYLPVTLEEKIVSHADNMVDGDKVVGVEAKAKRAADWLGKDHPAVKRLKSLEREIESLL